MIELGRGNILEVEAEALVNTVNCVGVMGKGIALQFKRAFPHNYAAYRKACDAGDVAPGRMHVHATSSLVGPRIIINFPTKRHWRNPSQLDDVTEGLRDLVWIVREHGIQSIAVPPLGCGNGGLDWAQVEPLIRKAFEPLETVRVILYTPGYAPSARERRPAPGAWKWTPARSLMVQLMDAYRQGEYRLSLLEIQKLAYFMQEAGEPMKLNFVKAVYGPYADNVSHLLQSMEGHAIDGATDERSPETEIGLLEGAAEEARDYAIDSSTVGRLTRVLSLIEGFETPYGMELLASVHWVARESVTHERPLNDDALVQAIHAWNERKRRLLKPEHIRVAAKHLRAHGWMGQSLAVPA